MLHVQQLDSTYHQLCIWHKKYVVKEKILLFKYSLSVRSVVQFGSIKTYCRLWKKSKAKLCPRIDPLDHRKRECKTILVKTVELASGKTLFYPLMTYCYIDLKTSLQNLLLDPYFTSHCNHWKALNSSDDQLNDVYDGCVWKRFKQFNGLPFLDDDYSYAFMLNMDWFKPYKHLTYSVGVIYLSIFNFPRSIRYQLRNICLIGIIPGPREPELTKNQYLDPLIDDLLKLWNKIELEICLESGIERKLIRGAVICCS